MHTLESHSMNSRSSCCGAFVVDPKLVTPWLRTLPENVLGCKAVATFLFLSVSSNFKLWFLFPAALLLILPPLPLLTLLCFSLSILSLTSLRLLRRLFVLDRVPDPVAVEVNGVEVVVGDDVDEDLCCWCCCCLES